MQKATKEASGLYFGFLWVQKAAMSRKPAKWFRAKVSLQAQQTPPLLESTEAAEGGLLTEVHWGAAPHGCSFQLHLLPGS